MTKKSRKKKPDTMLFSFGILPFVAGGFTDSLNPCGLTVLFFFVAFFLFLSHKRPFDSPTVGGVAQGSAPPALQNKAGGAPQVMVKGGCCFILGLFLSKLLLIGPLDDVRSSAVFWTICRFFYLWIALVALVLAGFHLRDWWVYKKTQSLGSLKIKFPLGLQENPQPKASSQEISGRSHRGQRNIPFFSFIGGGLLGMLGSICPEPFYIATFLYTLTIQGHLSGVILGWLMYSLGFILPLIAVLFFLALGIRSQRLGVILKEHVAMLKIVCSAVLLAMGLGLIYTFY